jgi:hypothetical protein
MLGAEDDSDSDDDDSEDGPEKQTQKQSKAARHELGAAMNDLWEELDPHDVTSIAPKPFRKGTVRQSGHY